MSSRYYDNYYNAPQYQSSRSRPYPYYYSKQSQSSRNSYSYQPTSPKSPKSKPRSKALRKSGAYSPTLGRKKAIGHWKAKKKQKEEKKTKRGEFNQETIEAELNKYKKGVFYHDDKAKQEKKTKLNGHSKSKGDSKQYSQYQLTRTQQPPPQVYEDLPRAVPPNYEQRIKSNENSNDDNDDRKQSVTRKEKEEIKKEIVEDTKQQKPSSWTKKKPQKPQRTKVGKKRGDQRYIPMVTVSPSRLQPSPYGAFAAPPRDYYYQSMYGPPPPQYYDRDEMYAAMPPYPPYPGYGQPEYYGGYGQPMNRGYVQDDGSWYPYPDILQQQQPNTTNDPYTTPKQNRRKKNRDSANVDLTTPANDKKSNAKMTPGRRVNKIQKQLEYYFSVQNMNNDDFLRGSMNENGWVHVDIVVAFNRMKTLGATKELVVEAAFHSTTIEIDAKSQDKIRMTKYWKQFVAKNESNKKKSSSSIKKKSSSSSSSSKAKEKELDNAEVNEQTIDAIVAGIEKKMQRKKKKREQREKEKAKKAKKDKEKEAKELIKKDKEENNNDDAGDPEHNDMVEID